MKFGTLNSYSLVKFTGSDAATFLQGQLTNDINLLDTEWQFTGYCNPKGRLLALFQLWKSGSNEFHALLSKDLTDSILKRLRMFVMRSDVEITEIDTDISGFDSLQTLIEQHPNQTKDSNLEIHNSVSINENGGFVLNVADRYIMISEQTGDSQPYDSQWTAKNITDGLPEIRNTSSELFIPQMLNLDLINGISFKKGCYTGQEIVARMHYLGNLKQRMFTCITDSKIDNITFGEKIYNNLNERKTVGNIVSAAENNNTVLAVLRLDNSNSDLYLDGGQKVRATDLQPYPIPH